MARQNLTIDVQRLARVPIRRIRPLHSRNPWTGEHAKVWLVCTVVGGITQIDRVVTDPAVAQTFPETALDAPQIVPWARLAVFTAAYG